MDQELKQRLIGAAVITALAAIFVPMLFDDPIDETGKSINELKIPELPVKQQEVEIMPLPEKVEDVAVVQQPEEKNAKPTPKLVEEGAAEAGLNLPKPAVHAPVKDAAAVKRLQVVEPDAAVVADEDLPISEAEDIRPAIKPGKPTPQPAQNLANANLAPKAQKPVTKPVDTAVSETAAKPAVNEAGTRWYLNAGSFAQKVNALSLQDNLKQQGFPASVKEVAGEKGVVYKVRIGPMLDRAKAQAVKNKLTQINVNSFVSPDD